MLGALGGQAKIVSDEQNGGAEFRSQTVEVVEEEPVAVAGLGAVEVTATSLVLEGELEGGAGL